MALEPVIFDNFYIFCIESAKLDFGAWFEKFRARPQVVGHFGGRGFLTEC